MTSGSPDNSSLMDTLKNLAETTYKTVTFPVHSAGWPFIALFAVVSLLLAFVSDFLGGLGFVLTIWCVYFFRNPKRAVPQQKGLVVSPADGRVVAVTPNAVLPAELEVDEKDAPKSWTRISVFLSVFNVHVNRTPIAGEVKSVVYHPGKFLNAAADKASDDNERSSTLLKSETGDYVAFVQIAGFVARRIINNLNEDMDVETGAEMGIIRFGSRVDVYIPGTVQPLVTEGQTAIAGETVLADIASKAKTPRKTKIL